MRSVVNDLTQKDIELGLKYFENEFLTDMQYTIEPEFIEIHNKSAMFCHIRRSKLTTLEDIQEKLTTIAKICKERKIELKNLTKTKKYITDNYLKYANHIAIKQYLFDKLKNNMEIIQKSGLRVCYIDDIQFKVAIEPYEEIQRMKRPTDIEHLISHFTRILNDLSDSKQPYNQSKIVL